MRAMLHFPAMREQADAIIIGAGIIGVSVALEMSRRGRHVIVIDRLAQAGLGSTSKSTAIIRQLYAERHSMALAIEGLLFWEEWSEFLGADARPPLAEFRQTGVLWVWNAIELARQPLAVLRELGADMEYIDGADLPRRFPNLRFDDEKSHRRSDEKSRAAEPAPLAGLLERRGGFVTDPQLAVRNLAEKTTALGAQWILGDPVVAFEHDDAAVPSGGRRRVASVTTAGGRRIEAPVVVNAAGPHSGHVNALAGSPLPLTTAPNLQHFIDGSDDRPEWRSRIRNELPVCADPAGGIYFKPDPDRFRVGCVLPSDDVHFPVDADLPLPTPGDDFVNEKLARLRNRAPDVALTGVTGGGGLYDVTVADWCPIVDRTDVDGYFVCIGTSGKWFKSAPILGWLTAELVDWVGSGRNPDRPDQRLIVKLPRSGNRLELADFARWRTPHRTAGVLA
jgi:sarcosine oxidase subunit beta